MMRWLKCVYMFGFPLLWLLYCHLFRLSKRRTPPVPMTDSLYSFDFAVCVCMYVCLAYWDWWVLCVCVCVFAPCGAPFVCASGCKCAFWIWMARPCAIPLFRPTSTIHFPLAYMWVCVFGLRVFVHAEFTDGFANVWVTLLAQPNSATSFTRRRNTQPAPKPNTEQIEWAFSM